MQVQSGHRWFWWVRAWWSKNPLLRSATRAERASTVGAAALCLALMLSVPLVAVVTWSAASARIAHPKAVHTVQATVTAPTDAGSELGRAPVRIPYAKTVQWEWNGRQHTGQLPATTAPAQGQTKPVRVDEHGDLLSSLFSTGSAVTFAVLATVAAAVTAIGLALGALRLRGHWLLRRRATAWEREWEHVQPLWTGRG